MKLRIIKTARGVFEVQELKPGYHIGMWWCTKESFETLRQAHQFMVMYIDVTLGRLQSQEVFSLDVTPYREN